MNVDGQILLWIQNNVRSETLTPIVLWLTNSIPYAAGLFVVLLFFRKTRKFAIFALSGLAVCLVCNAYVVKPLFARPRPFASVAGLQRIGPMPGGSSFHQSYDRCLCAGMDECLVQEKILDRAPVCVCLSCSGNKIVSWRSLSDRYSGRDRGGVCTELSYI